MTEPIEPTLSDLLDLISAAPFNDQLVALQVFSEVANDLPTYRDALEQGLIEAGIMPAPEGSDRP